MSTTESIISSQTKQSVWRKIRYNVDAGFIWYRYRCRVLFFPIRAGFGGVIPILLMLVLAYPIAFIATVHWRACACRGQIHPVTSPRR